MGKSSYDSSRRSQDMMAGKADRALKREKRLREEGKLEILTSKEDLKRQINSMERGKDFRTLYPTFARWECELKEKINLHIAIDEISGYTKYKGIKAYQWIQSLYEKSISPKMAVIEIKKLLNW